MSNFSLLKIPLIVLNKVKLGFFKFLIGICGTSIFFTSYPYSVSLSASIAACPPIPPENLGDMKSSLIIAVKHLS